MRGTSGDEAVRRDKWCGLAAGSPVMTGSPGMGLRVWMNNAWINRSAVGTISEHVRARHLLDYKSLLGYGFGFFPGAGESRPCITIVKYLGLRTPSQTLSTIEESTHALHFRCQNHTITLSAHYIYADPAPGSFSSLLSTQRNSRSLNRAATRGCVSWPMLIYILSRIIYLRAIRTWLIYLQIRIRCCRIDVCRFLRPQKYRHLLYLIILYYITIKRSILADAQYILTYLL